MKENGFTLVKARSRPYPAQTITDADYADDIALLANTPAQVESLLDSLEKAVASLGHHVNANKMEYMCFNQNQKGDISTLKGGSLKLVEKFIYIEIKNNINTWLAKAWTANDRLSNIWRSDLSDKTKQFFPDISRVNSNYMDAPHGRWQSV